MQESYGSRGGRCTHQHAKGSRYIKRGIHTIFLPKIPLTKKRSIACIATAAIACTYSSLSFYVIRSHQNFCDQNSQTQNIIKCRKKSKRIGSKTVAETGMESCQIRSERGLIFKKNRNPRLILRQRSFPCLIQL